MPINSFLYPGAKFSPPYEVANSLRINSGDDCKLSRTSPNSSPTNADKFTISFWIKRSNIDAGSGHEHQQVFTTYDGSGSPYQEFQIYFTQNTLRIQTYNSSNQMELVTNRVFRDVSAWYSIIFVYDSSQGTASNRAKLYINGVQETSFSTETYPSQNVDGEFAIQNHIQMIGNNSANNRDLGCYLAEFVGVDGQALAYTEFGEFDSDTNIWIPKDVSGIDVGTLGFYLDFKNSSALGTDASGVGNFSLTNLAAIDQTTDTCTNNFATLNPLLDVNATPTLTEGNLVFQGTGSTNFAGATIPVSSGKWYVEVKATTVSGSYPIIGVIDAESTLRRNSTYFVAADVDSNNPSGFAVFANGDIYHNNSSTYSDLTTTYTSGNIIGMALNMDASPNTLGFYKNGALEVTINLDTAPSGAYMFASGVHSSASSGKGEFNFGNPTFSISSGNSDANGYGNFEYSVPSGYYSLCTQNLAEYG